MLKPPILCGSRFWAAVLIIGTTGAFWFIPENVANLISINQPVLLGRYSVDRFIILIIISSILLAALYIFIAKKNYRRLRAIKVTAFACYFLVSLIIGDLAYRFIAESKFVYIGDLVLHAPNQVHRQIYTDIPGSKKSYPVQPPGYPDFSLTMTIDGAGFRNPQTLSQAEILVIGDSFGEGARVSDEQTWFSILRSNTKTSLYNISKGGDDPGQYLEKLRKYGLLLDPGVVIVMLYESNDFKMSRDPNEQFNPNLKQRIRKYLRKSPIRHEFKRVLDLIFGGINSNSTFKNSKAIDWIPFGLAAEDGNTDYYTFNPKVLPQLYKDQNTFTNSQGWKNTRSVMKSISGLSKAHDFRLIFVYAPSKDRIVLPLVIDELPNDNLFNFAQIRKKYFEGTPLSTSDDFVRTLLKNLDSIENTVAGFCSDNQVDFISLTEAIREQTSLGKQTYFTYDAHWSPDGNAIAAETITNYLKANPGGTVNNM